MEQELSRLRALIEEQEREGKLRLPPEPRLCEILDVSRARLRTLLKRLENQGAIWRHVGKGTFIGSRPALGEEIAEKLAISASDLFEARILIEPLLAAQAAQKATPPDVAAMEQVLVDMRASESFFDWKRLDGRLHRLIAQATHNPLLVLQYDTLRMSLRVGGLDARLEEVFGAPPQPRASTNAEHREIVDAIASHRPGRAEQLMREHIESVRAQLFA